MTARRLLPVAALVLGMCSWAPHAAAETDPTTPIAGFAELSAEYSRAAVAQEPLLGELLHGLGLRHLNQLDPAKVYGIDRATKQITVEDPRGEVGTAGVFFGLGSVVSTIRAAGGDIVGQGKTVVTCPFGAQTAAVSGFMASTVSRDPVGGIRNGFIFADDFLTTGAEVDFRIIKAAGGARNPINRTAMETTHTGSCGGEVKVQNVVATWPPLRVELAVDDTGSMGNELAGVKSALAGFIGSRNTDYDQVQRGVSYELISFKDSPSLRLANTEDTAAAIAAVNGLSARGGGDCPEDSLGAVNMALDRLTADEDSAGEIVLVTDASPHSGDIGPAIARARGLGVPVHVMLSGDCVAATAGLGTAAATPSARVVFEQLARETGGLFFFRPNGSAADYAEILRKIFEEAVTPGDVVAPTVTVTATPTSIWPPNHRMVHIDTKVTATDDTDPSPTVELVGVTSTEPDDGQGDGTTADDIEITEDGRIFVRAERSGTGGGRIYTVTYRATDKAGNTGYGSIDIEVHHNQ
ncbi:hypothetical protein SUDANB95_03462 [Actinosynnema sp. ALI-1.44]